MPSSQPNSNKQDVPSQQKIEHNCKLPNSFNVQHSNNHLSSPQHLHQTIKQLNQQLQIQKLQNNKLEKTSQSLSLKIASLITELNSLKEENTTLKNQQAVATDYFQDSTLKGSKLSDDLNSPAPSKKLHSDHSNQSSSNQTLFCHSKIITEEQNKITIQQFFVNKVIKKASLLYRASDHTFETKKFHEKCNGISNTLTVCLTQFNKKIGGFTPLSWKISSINQEWKTDNSKESFIFSLTHNEKLALKEPSRAICNGSNNGPSFGNGPDLMIKNKGNENLCIAEIGMSYQNQNFKTRSKETYERFTGNANNSGYFRVKDWEVWKLEFDKQVK